MILIACERSGVIRSAFRRAGYEAFSCDVEPSDDGSPFHIREDVRNIVHSGWDLMIAHPPCRFLCASGLHWNRRNPDRHIQTLKALAFVRFLLDVPIGKIAVENPVGCISTNIRPPDQYIQPYEFGHNASKRTGLWLKGLPLLKATSYIEPRMVNGRPRWANQTDSGQNNLAPNKTRSQQRARTYEGIASAMVEQWGRVLT